MANGTKAAVELADKINGLLRDGKRVLISNHLSGVKLSKKHAGAVVADGNGIRIYRGAFWLLGTFQVVTY
jgi:hypothetical protein